MERCKPTRPNPLDFVLDSFRHSMWPTAITGPSPGGYSGGGGRGGGAELDDEHSGSRFRRQPRRLLNGWMVRCFASIRIAGHKARVAATFRRETKQFEDGIRLMHLPYSARVRWNHCLSRRHLVIEQGMIIGAIGSSGGTIPAAISIGSRFDD